MGQDQNYSKVDRHALGAGKSQAISVPVLAEYLGPSHYSDREKVRSVYVWIKHNIHYDRHAVSNNEYRYNFDVEEVLNRRKAVCTGYSNLFNKLCDEINITAYTVSGYSRGTPTSHVELEAPDHAWNAVLLDSTWYLVDVTWASGLISDPNTWRNGDEDQYFLSPPEMFIRDHLPAQPMWQLLDCPLTAEDFRTRTPVVHSKNPCYNFEDTLNTFFALPERKRKVIEAEMSYRFNPTEANQRELGHSYLDFASVLVDSSEQYVLSGEWYKLATLQHEVIDYCEKAENLTDFHNWQKEMFAHTLINYATTLFNNGSKKERDPALFYSKLEAYLEKAYNVLKSTESTYFVRSAMKQHDVLKNIISGYKDRH